MKSSYSHVLKKGVLCIYIQTCIQANSSNKRIPKSTRLFISLTLILQHLPVIPWVWRCFLEPKFLRVLFVTDPHVLYLKKAFGLIVLARFMSTSINITVDDGPSIRRHQKGKHVMFSAFTISRKDMTYRNFADVWWLSHLRTDIHSKLWSYFGDARPLPGFAIIT